MNFESIIGNEKNKQLLTNIIKNNNISHSYMFLGQEGIGKFLFAKGFAKEILCLNKNEECDTCKSCIEFNTNNHPDFNIIEPDGNNIKIEQIRLLMNKIIEKPVLSEKKVYIINDADCMTREAANCLLKTLEEPPEYMVLILIGKNENLFLNTIRSRCTKIIFEDIEDYEIKKLLEENYQFSDITDSMLKMFEGSIKKALSVKENKEQYEQVEKIFSNIEKYNIIDLLKEKEIILKNKDILLDLLDYINVIFLQLSRKNSKYIKCIFIVNNAKEKLKYNSNLDMTIDELLILIWEEVNEKHNRS